MSNVNCTSAQRHHPPTVNRDGGHLLLRGCLPAAGPGRLKGNATEYREIPQDRLVLHDTPTFELNQITVHTVHTPT